MRSSAIRRSSYKRIRLFNDQLVQVIGDRKRITCFFFVGQVSLVVYGVPEFSKTFEGSERTISRDFEFQEHTDLDRVVSARISSHVEDGLAYHPEALVDVSDDRGRRAACDVKAPCESQVLI